MFPALVAAHRPGRWGSLLLAACQSPFALPGIIIGLSFVLLVNRWAPMLYGTVVVLVIGVVFRLLPQAVTANESALRAVSLPLEQAARTLGNNGFRTFQRVTLPVAAPGLLASWVLAFVTAMKELPTVILLRPPGFDTLPVRIWMAASEFGAYSGGACRVRSDCDYHRDSAVHYAAAGRDGARSCTWLSEVSTLAQTILLFCAASSPAGMPRKRCNSCTAFECSDLRSTSPCEAR